MKLSRLLILFFGSVALSVSSYAQATSFRLFEVGVNRFSLRGAQAWVERGRLDARGRFTVDSESTVLSIVTVPAEAYGKLLITLDAYAAYLRLGEQAMANFIVDDFGPFYAIGRDYVNIAVSPQAIPEVGIVPNLSTRGRVIPGQPLIGGFVVTDNPRRVLVRVVGPGLKPHGVDDAAADPLLTLYRGSTAFNENDNWSERADAAPIETATAKCGAFPLARGSTDAVLLETLSPGAYTVHAQAKAPGSVLVEVYLLD
jgi:hypothetical protein